jgi:hypothetical protein
LSALRAEVETTIALDDPVLRNFRITLGYHVLAQARAARLGADAACNWHFIAELFRCFQYTAAVAGAPYDAAQVATIRSGRIPPPPH